ncbi:MAG: type II secretion system F family protein [Candidatus Diapherotrites archaeon]|nr:type II secretion system F family protein [Candidatus Diapherotrites archaeon]
MFYERAARIIPPKITHAFKKELEYLDINVSEKSFVGFLLLYGFFLSAGISANAYFFFLAPPIPLFAFCYTIFFLITYLWLSLAAESKGKFVESILPDALQLVASNMKSGMTAERALIFSARKEFGPLEKELREAAKRIIAGQSLNDSLLLISKKIKSVSLERTLWLISEGMKSGGQIADLLVELSNDLRQQQALKQEIAADVSIYQILIFSASAFGAPLLFGISSFIVEVLSKKISSFSDLDIGNIPSSGSGGFATSFIQSGKEALSPEFVLLFSMASLVATSVFASLTMGVINTGKEKNGVKFIPMVLLIAFALFFLVRWFLLTTFSDLLK